jgi:hypothetical protein
LNFLAVTLTRIVGSRGAEATTRSPGNGAINVIWGGIGNDRIDGMRATIPWSATTGTTCWSAAWATTA